MGYTFKKNCSDIRNTQIEKVFKLLNKSFKNINIYDPYVDKNLLDSKLKRERNQLPKKNYYDSIIITVDHNIFKKLGKKNILKFLKNNKKLIFDLNNLFKSKKILSIFRFVNILIIKTFPLSFEDWDKIGTLDREISVYKKIYKTSGNSISFFSFGNKEEKNILKN